MTAIILWGLCLLIQGPANIVRIPAGLGVDEMTFDPSRVSVLQVKRWIQLSPLADQSPYLVPENIESCPVNDPRYEGCGKGEQGIVNLHNALLSLDEIKQHIEDLDPSRYPADLSEVVTYLRRYQSFALWAESQKLAFVTSWDVFVLESTFDAEGIDPKVSCSAALNRIAGSTSRTEQSKLARFDWFNCVLSVAKQRIGRYPQNAWEKFLTDHGIHEHYVEDEIDD